MYLTFNKLQHTNENGKFVVKLIQREGPITKSQLIHLTKMKLSTLNRVMQSLLEDKLIVDLETGQSTGGRKPVLFDINPKSYYSVGIDISRTYIKILVTNMKMEIVSQQLYTQCYSPEETVELISESINKILDQLGIDKSLILGIGVGTVGPLDRKKGVMINPKNFPTNDWVKVPIKDMLEEKVGLATIIDNGGNTAVLAEHLFGMGKGLDSMAYINCGIGIRTGAINSGTIIRTINNTEDVFGHMVIDVDGEPCSCGNYGCIECYSSILAITKKFISEVKKGHDSLINRPLEEISYIDICAAAEKGDELARGVIISAALTFGAGLSNYINLLNPKLVVLSGPLIKHSKLFYDTCTDAALKRLYFKEENMLTFSRGGCFQDNAIAVGAAVEVIEETFAVNS